MPISEKALRDDRRTTEPALRGLHALLVCYNFPPWAGGASVRADAFARYLPLYNVRPTVLTINERYIDELEPYDPGLVERLGPEVRVVRTRSIEPDGAAKTRIRNAIDVAGEKPSLIGRALGALRRWVEPLLLCPDYTVLWAPHALAAARRIARSDKIDVVYAVGPPYGALVVGWLISLALRKPLVIDIKDVWINGPLYNTASAVRRALERWWERRVVRRATRTVLVTRESERSHLERHAKLDPARFVLIPNGADPLDFSDAPAPAAGKLLITVAGMLDQRRDPRPLLHACKTLIQERVIDPVKIEITIPGNVLPQYSEFGLRELPPEVARFVDALPRREFARLLCGSHLLVLLPSRGIPSAIPGKLYEYLLARRPILTMAEPGAAAELIERHNVGTLIAPDDQQGAAQVVREIYDQVIEERWKPAEHPPELLRSIDRRELTAELATLLRAAADGA
ncbi:MAG: glycosyltransferase [Candidatus Alcyoniella australis]|nr:glycosyltransferase [Candidatus Alcyoniella australis]